MRLLKGVSGMSNEMVWGATKCFVGDTHALFIRGGVNPLGLTMSYLCGLEGFTFRLYSLN